MTYNWNRNWFWEYQSIWCSIERFKYANELTNLDISKLVDAKRRYKNVFIYSSFYYSNYYIEESKLSSLFNEDIFKNSEFILKDLLGPIYNNIDIKKYMVYVWRFCPICIKFGYHSIYHQVSFFENCVFHNIPLQTECPDCKKETTYSIEFNKYNQAFTCKCGYSHIHDNFKNIFELWNSKNVSTNLKKIRLEGFSFIYSSFKWFNNIEILKDEVYSLKNTDMYNILSCNNIDERYTFKFNPIFKNKKLPSLLDKDNSSYDYLGNFMMDEYINILKSIARKIRRKYRIKSENLKFFSRKRIYLLSDYKSSNTYIDGIYYKDINSYLYAYIMWRKVFEGHENYTTIHEPIYLREEKDSMYIIRMNITLTKTYKYICSEIRNYKVIYEKNQKTPFSDYGIIISAFERILCKIFIDYFNTLVEYIDTKKKNCPNQIIDFKENIPIKVPDFIICLDNKHMDGYLIEVK